MRSIAFVGAGPTSIYTLHALVGSATRSFALTIFEEQAAVGRGTPYRPGWNDPAMLSNIASIEIPPLEQSLVEWLRAQTSHRLAKLGVAPDEIGERTFYPRLVLGDFFYDQCLALLARAEIVGIKVTVRTRCRVIDAVSGADGMVLKVQPRKGDVFQERFDHVVMATGHQWPAAPEVRPGYFLSPWPASDLAKVPACEVGIRGTSLTGIDASVALAVTHGEFFDGASGELEYASAPHTDNFHMTMMSRKGLLPEADFYAPLPYRPLSIFTPEAVRKLIDGETELLDRAFALFKLQLSEADTDYAEEVGLEKLGLEEFHDRYFADRAASDPFEWAKKNLEEAQRNYRDKITVGWRYTILRMHEVMEPLVPHFEEQDFERFSRFFKPIFVDDYATVPHKSIRRMLALHRAGKLDIIALGDDYRIDSYRPGGGAELEVNGTRWNYPVFIEAIGQRPLAAKDFPFPSLLRQGVIHDAVPNATGKVDRGIAIDDQFHPISDKIPCDQLFCLSLPFILGRHPFHQGITSSHEMGVIVADQLATALDKVAEPNVISDKR
jgi:uncharacterized NAD(P)/FAD-binding protein YdhS